MKQLKSAKVGLVIAFLILLFSGCDNSKPIKIGLIAGLSGRLSDTGGEARNGVLLAVDEINRQGGIDGRPVEIIFKDDRQQADALKSGLDELQKEGVRLIIGPLTSQMGINAVEATNDSQLIFISPTISTPILSGLDDNFFRIYPHSDQLTDRLAQYLVDKTSVRSICIVADTSNAAFTVPSMERIESTFTILGGSVEKQLLFNSVAESSLHNIARQLKSFECDGVVAFTSAVDLALICQQLAKLGVKLPVFTTEWAYSTDLIELGGKPVEQVTLVHTFNQDDQTPKGQKFIRSYEKNFGYKPNFAALNSYDATKIAIMALHSDSEDDVSKVLVEMKNFEGVQADIKFDKHGDVIRDIFMSQIIDGRFVQMQRL